MKCVVDAISINVRKFNNGCSVWNIQNQFHISCWNRIVKSSIINLQINFKFPKNIFRTVVNCINCDVVSLCALISIVSFCIVKDKIIFKFFSCHQNRFSTNPFVNNRIQVKIILFTYIQHKSSLCAWKVWIVSFERNCCLCCLKISIAIENMILNGIISNRRILQNFQSDFSAYVSVYNITRNKFNFSVWKFFGNYQFCSNNFSTKNIIYEKLFFSIFKSPININNVCMHWKQIKILSRNKFFFNPFNNKEIWLSLLRVFFCDFQIFNNSVDCHIYVFIFFWIFDWGNFDLCITAVLIFFGQDFESVFSICFFLGCVWAINLHTIMPMHNFNIHTNFGILDINLDLLGFVVFCIFLVGEKHDLFFRYGKRNFLRATRQKHSS